MYGKCCRALFIGLTGLCLLKAELSFARAVPVPMHKPSVSKEHAGDNENLAAVDADETQALPDYPAGARISIGEMKTYIAGEEDTFLDIARHFSLGYVELRAVNPGGDPWSPVPGAEIVLPTFKLLPRAKQEGIVVNLGEMRMYYFKDEGEAPLTFPLGIGREGLQTPTGQTTIIKKMSDPMWFPTDRMRKEKPWLPAAIAAGAANPLGTHALYLGWPTFLIHGSNKPWGIGRRVSSGCMRMYPEDIVMLFDMVPIGTKVTVVDQPILAGWLEDGFYLEVNASKTQVNEIESDKLKTIKPLTKEIEKVIIDASGLSAKEIDWRVVKEAMHDRRGVPVRIALPKGQKKPSAPVQEFSYN